MRVFALEHGSGNAPLNVARKSERNEGLARSEADALFGKYFASLIAVGEFVELDCERSLFRLFDKLMFSHLILDGEVGVHIVVHNVDNGRFEELADSFLYDLTDVILCIEHFHIIFEKRIILGEFEIPVCNVTEHGAKSRKCGAWVDEVHGHILMTEVALVCVALFGLAALNGAFADDLSAVEERADLFIVELRSCDLLRQPFS